MITWKVEKATQREIMQLAIESTQGEAAVNVNDGNVSRWKTVFDDNNNVRRMWECLVSWPSWLTILTILLAGWFESSSNRARFPFPFRRRNKAPLPAARRWLKMAFPRRLCSQSAPLDRESASTAPSSHPTCPAASFEDFLSNDFKQISKESFWV